MSQFLYQRIFAYAASKEDSGYNDHNAVKKRVFTKIGKLVKTNKLTVHALTEILSQLPDEERFKLFYLARKLGSSFQQKASPSSKAGQLIAEIYRTLNVSLSDLDLAIIVAEGISEKNSTFIKAFRYQYWQRYSLSRLGVSHLEHELKGLLELEDTKEPKPLADLLFSKETEELLDSLVLLYDAAPAYIPELVNQLYTLHKTKGTADEFIETLLTIASEVSKATLVGIPANKLTELLANSNSEIALALVKKGLQNFFSLPSFMQHAVQASLERNIDFETLSHLRGQFDTLPFSDFELKQVFQLLTNGGYRLSASLNNEHEAHEVFNALSDMVYKKAMPYQEKACGQMQAKPAIEAINAYLKEDPNTFKATFFQNLAQAINAEGLSIEVLQAHLTKTTLNKLFAKWSGPENSRAAGLMANLYELASLGTTLTVEQIKEMVTVGSIPLSNRNKLSKRSELLLRERITQVLLHPEKTTNSFLDQIIGKVVAYYQSFLQFSNKVKAFEQKHVEAKYQNYLLQKGLALADEQEQAIFDPQGHVLVMVPLDTEDYALLVSDLTDGKIKEGTKEQLEALLGTRLTESTFCNLDIANHASLRQKFKQSMQGIMPSENFNEVLEHYLSSQERGSVIALQEEMSMHISLSLRAIEKLVAEFNNRELESGELSIQMLEPKLKIVLGDAQRNNLIHEMNQLVLATFRGILVRVYDKNSEQFDYVYLNRELDADREALAPSCRELLVKALCLNMEKEELEIFHQEVLPTLEERFFTSTTATGLDYLRSDASNETVVRISATEATAHNKGLGADKQALRILARNRYHDNSVIPYDEATIEARVPSIGDKKASHYRATQDVASKLAYSYQLLRQKAAGYRGPMVYNLLTSLHTRVYDNTFFDKQRLTAARILKGAHLYNLQQLQSGESRAFVYVQNVPVNQHTNELSVDAFDDATAEASLMTDVALLATFKHHAVVFPPALRESIIKTNELIHFRYLHFLPLAQGGTYYFKDSAQGVCLIKELATKKRQWQVSKPMVPADTIQALVVQTLFKMLSNNEHYNKQFGMLTQVLSIFIEPMSQAGCKSANERYQAVGGRVELLKSISEVSDIERLSGEHKAIRSALEHYVAGRATLAEVQAALDLAYNRHNVQGSAAAFSEEDQGAPSKLKATTNKRERGVVTEINTNYAESNYLENLSQKSAASMQAHKANLPKAFKELFERELSLTSELVLTS